MSIEYRYYDTLHPDFVALTRLLDLELAEKNGSFQAVYSQYNGLDKIRDVVVAYEDEKPVGCASMKYFEPGTYEVKRVYVAASHRRRGIAEGLMHAIEEKAVEKGLRFLVLETGRHLSGTISLYTKLSYEFIENYGQYKDLEQSVCFRKTLRAGRT